MAPGTKEQAMELAKQRWSQAFPFDLHPESWDAYFDAYPAGQVLQAIRIVAKWHRNRRKDTVRAAQEIVTSIETALRQVHRNELPN